MLSPEKELINLIELYEVYWIELDKISTILIGEVLPAISKSQGILGKMSSISDILMVRLYNLNHNWDFDHDDRGELFDRFTSIMEDETKSSSDKLQILLDFKG